MAGRTTQTKVHDTGLSILYEPADPVVEYEALTSVYSNVFSLALSILFVHGLQGHPRKTWAYKVTSPTGSPGEQGKSQRSGGKKIFSKNEAETKGELKTAEIFWPADLLPNDCPDARIITWGYNSNISNYFRGPANKNSLFDHAKDLLRALGRLRSDCQKRRLIFVAHSLGGIIVKEVLRRASTASAERDVALLDICSSTTAILFLGTPHRGSQMAELGITLKRIATVAGFDTSDKNLRALRMDSAELEVSHEGFMPLYEQHRFAIRTFQEAQGMTGVGLFKFNEKVVDNVSSTLTGSSTEHTETIHANHMSMCRFSSEDDDGYRKVGGELQILVRAERERLQEMQRLEKTVLTPEEQRCLQSLSYREMYGRIDAIPTVFAETCTSLLKHRNYSTWLHERGLLWMKGKPGSGKSTLMKFAFRETQALASRDGLVVAAFFFHGSGTQLQKSSLGLFRSLLYQLLAQHHFLRSEFLRSIYAGNIEGSDCDWRVGQLQDFFSSRILQAAARQPVYIFIDALDECDELDEQGQRVSSNLVSFFKTIASQADGARSSLGICFSSRHYPIIPSDDIPEFCVEDGNRSDISSYVRAKLQSYSGVREALEGDIINTASGIFSWAVLATRRVLELHTSGRNSLANIAKKLHDADKGLIGVYEQILKNLGDDDNYRLKTLHLMQWICLAERPLSLTELRIAIALDVRPPHASQQPRQDSDEYVDSDARMEKLVKSLSGGLVEVQCHQAEDVVQFIHQSAKDYFLRDGLRILDSSYTGSAVGNGHHRLSRSCFNYFAMKKLRSSDLTDRGDVIRRFPFMKYAAAFSFLHAKKAESEGYSQADLLPLFQWPSQDIFQCWLSAFRLIHAPSRRCPGQEASLLRIVSEYNLLGLVQLLVVEEAERNAKDEYKRTALHGAARNGHNEVVRLLVENGAEVNAKDDDGETVLHWAAENGHETMVQFLLKNRADIGMKTKCAETVLHRAAGYGNEAVARLLVENGAQINAEDDDGETAMHWAARSGHESLVRFLVEKGAEVNVQNKYGETALDAAVGSGHEKVVWFLVGKGAEINVEVAESVLHWAAGYGNEAVVRLLVEKGGEINAKDDDGETAMHWAARSGHEALVRFLVERGAEVDVQNKCGETALDAAASSGQKAVVLLLSPLTSNA